MNQQATRHFEKSDQISINSRTSSGGRTCRLSLSRSAQQRQGDNPEEDDLSSSLTISPDKIDEPPPLKTTSQLLNQLEAEKKINASEKKEREYRSVHVKQDHQINQDSTEKVISLPVTRKESSTVIDELRRFSASGHREHFRTELRRRRRQTGESLQTVHDDVCWLFGLAYPGASGAMSKLVIRDTFLDSLGDDDLCTKVLEKQPLDVGEALLIATQVEGLRQLSDENRTNDGSRSSSKPLLPAAAAISSVKNVKFVPKSRQILLKWPPGLQLRFERCRGKKNIACTTIDARGTRIPTTATRKHDGTRVRAYRTESMNSSSDVFLHMTVNDTVYPVIIDTGCEKSLVPFDVVKHLTLTPTNQRVFAVNGTELEIFGTVFLQFHLNDLSTSANLLVTPDVEETMLGVDWLRFHDCLWDFRNEVLYVNEPLTTVPSQLVCDSGSDNVRKSTRL